MPKVNPEILVWARETAGLTKAEAAKKNQRLRDTRTGSAVDKLNALEYGMDEPSRPVLVEMARVYRRPLLTFYLSKPPAKGERGADFRTLPAEHSGADEALMDALIRDIQARQSMVRAVLEEIEEMEPLAFIGSRRMEEGSATVLASMQEFLDVDLVAYRAQPNTGSAFDLLRDSVEKIGVFVIIKGDLGNYRSALGLKVFRGLSVADNLAPFIVINYRDAKAAWSFTLLHELAHLFMGHTGVSDEQPENEIERFCNDIASEFLLPSDEVYELTIRDDTEFKAIADRITEFANDRNVSRTMVAYQAYRSNIIGRSTYNRLDTRFLSEWNHARDAQRERTRNQKGGPGINLHRYRLGNGLLTFVQRMMRDGELSTVKAARILGIKPGRVGPLLESPH